MLLTQRSNKIGKVWLLVHEKETKFLFSKNNKPQGVKIGYENSRAREDCINPEKRLENSETDKSVKKYNPIHE